MRKAQIDHWVTPFSATAIWPASCEITFHYLRLIKTTFLRSPQRLSPIRSLHTTRPVMGQTLPANATLELANFLDNSNRNIKLPTTAPSSCITVKEVCDTNVHVILRNLNRARTLVFGKMKIYLVSGLKSPQLPLQKDFKAVLMVQKFPTTLHLTRTAATC